MNNMLITPPIRINEKNGAKFEVWRFGIDDVEHSYNANNMGGATYTSIWLLNEHRILFLPLFLPMPENNREEHIRKMLKLSLLQ